jgi:hypothetical protein
VVAGSLGNPPNKQTGLSYDVSLRDSGPVRSMTGAYPWKIARGYSTIAYLTNITDQETEFIAEINYNGGKFTLAPRKLAAGATAVFDLQKIRDAQMKDYAGKVLPVSVAIGQFRWAVRGVTDRQIVLIGRAEMVSLAEKLARATVVQWIAGRGTRSRLIIRRRCRRENSGWAPPPKQPLGTTAIQWAIFRSRRLVR